MASPDSNDTLGVAGGGCELVSCLVAFLALGKFFRHDIPKKRTNEARRNKDIRDGCLSITPTADFGLFLASQRANVQAMLPTA